jgi:CubicO group peptidase (beta-lactamase class C family)
MTAPAKLLAATGRPIRRSLGVLLGLVASATAWGESYRATRPSEITAAVKPFIDDHTIPGCVVLVADRDKLLCLEPVGSADLEGKQPMMADTMFWIASMTKAHACAAFMTLVDQGWVKTSDPVEKYFPEFKGQKVGKAGDPISLRAPVHPITLKECMTHTADLGEPKNKNKSLADNVADWGKLPLKYEPGKAYRYHLGIDIVGGVAERLTGTPFAEFIQRRLFDPLEMKDATFFPTPEQIQRLARIAQLKADKLGFEPIDPKTEPQKSAVVRGHVAWPSGGLFATATDVMKFCQMPLNDGTYKGRRILSAAAVKEMTSDQIAGIGTYGYGLNTVDKDGAFSAGSYQHRGAAGTHMWVDKRRQLVMVLLIQYVRLGPKETALCDAFTAAAMKKYAKDYKTGQATSGQALTARDINPW